MIISHSYCWRNQNLNNGFTSLHYRKFCLPISVFAEDVFNHVWGFTLPLTARRRAAAKRKKLKNLGKSKSTDTDEEENEAEEEDGQLKVA